MSTIKIGCWADPELRAQANSAAAELGITLSEYMRMALIHLANSRTNPFTQRSNVKPGRPATYFASRPVSN
jgi:antitoxin component of RelBE/YafQ-DinJ toxin-antitoxin module